jgi:pimeloyl-ACP methyl ester carboxylesterase
MQAGLPDARLHIVPGAGHAVHLEDPWAVAALIVATGGA